MLNSGRIVDVTRGVLGWDAILRAKQAFAGVSKQSQAQLFGKPLAYDMTALWAQQIADDISAHITREEFSSLKIGHIFIEAIFAGSGGNGELQLERSVVGRAGEYPQIGHTAVMESSLTDSMQYFVLGGRRPLFDEFNIATTERAKAEKQITLQQSKKWLPRDADARMVIRLTELVIKYEGSGTLHGPVDAMELDKGGAIRWIRRKPQCKDQR